MHCVQRPSTVRTVKEEGYQVSWCRPRPERVLEIYTPVHIIRLIRHEDRLTQQWMGFATRAVASGVVCVTRRLSVHVHFTCRHVGMHGPLMARKREQLHVALHLSDTDQIYSSCFECLSDSSDPCHVPLVEKLSGQSGGLRSLSAADHASCTQVVTLNIRWWFSKVLA